MCENLKKLTYIFSETVKQRQLEIERFDFNFICQILSSIGACKNLALLDLELENVI